MSNKVKMKCAVCHKSFKSSKPTQILCEDCERKRRLEKGTPTPVQPAQQPVVSAGAKPAWLEKAIVRDEKTPINLPTPRESQPPHPPTAPRADRPQRVTANREQPAAPVAAAPKKTPKVPPTPRESPKTPRPPKEPTKLFEPTPEQTAAIEQRYLELAHPEFDGIRTQVAHELQLPKSAVKHVIAALRARQHLPSWWEMQNFAGSPEDLERVKAAYTTLLPTPPLGVHKQIAQDLQLPPAQVYHAIRSIRLSLGMPIFNPPEMHPEMQTAAAHAEASAH